LQISPKAKAYLAEAGFDPLYGARPLKRTIQNLVQNPLARKVLAGEIKEGGTAVVDVGKDGIVLR
jgi:ATP-dependent Clp protease ATP-binding subunit ClpA